MALIVDEQAAGTRVDRFLVLHLHDESRAAIQRLILAGHVTREGRALKSASRLRPGDRLIVRLPEPPPSSLIPEQVSLTILHEDPDLLVVVKPAGMVVHPGAGVRAGTLVHALIGREGTLSGVGGVERPGIVHRLDRETSGLLLVARNDRAHRTLAGQFAARRVAKTYLTVVWGRPVPAAGRIEAPVGRHPVARTRMAVRRVGGRPSITEYRALETLGPFTFLEARPVTGRTHQIRVHLRHRGHPVAGDSRYGGDDYHSLRAPAVQEALEAFGRLALHAFALEFLHPVSGKRLRFEAPLPDDFVLLLQRLREAT